MQVKTQFNKMNREELFNYVHQNYRGKTKGDFRKSSKGAYERARKLEILQDLVKASLLSSAARKGYFNRMSNEQIAEFVQTNYAQTPIMNLEKENSNLYQTLLRRKLLDELVNRGVLVRVRNKYGKFNEMTDDKIMAYVKENYQGKNISLLARKDAALYRVMLQKRLIERACFESGLLRKNLHDKLVVLEALLEGGNQNGS